MHKGWYEPALARELSPVTAPDDLWARVAQASACSVGTRAEAWLHVRIFSALRVTGLVRLNHCAHRPIGAKRIVESLYQEQTI